ncbi:hypothetical protein P171DRAFT_470364 [Karstenula rhodostoma CBS 690.94]|uniref:Uncharacterized protein n=1 Tax=Karstenula rhodostoma CBS 690.94 TaxID=1392251 RepID=A0A9P4UFL9_9PLEO|nr:hypothetical protein P171DRAFT_470364 [Karstenula rhodostoma CBS 690.94]
MPRNSGSVSPSSCPPSSTHSHSHSPMKSLHSNIRTEPIHPRFLASIHLLLSHIAKTQHPTPSIMSMPTPATFPCAICSTHHPLLDNLPTGDSAHKPHCLFCATHTLYRTIIPASSAPRPTPEQTEKNNIIKTRKIVLSTIIPVAILAYFAFRGQLRFWPGIASGGGGGGERKKWQGRALRILLCIAGLAPCGFLLGFAVSVAYYTYFCLKKKRAKKHASHRKAASPSPDVPLEERPLAELRYRDLREMSEPIRIVVTPPESPPMRANRMSRVLSAVSGLRGGYDGRGYNGRGVRRESFRLEEMGGRTRRPGTEWPAL